MGLSVVQLRTKEVIRISSLILELPFIPNLDELPLYKQSASASAQQVKPYLLPFGYLRAIPNQ